MHGNMTRRKVLQFAAVAAFFHSLLPNRSIGGAAPPKDLIKSTDPLGMGIKYTHDASTADPKFRKKKMGVEGKDQDCTNCLQYKKTGDLNGEEVGTCKILAGGLVKGKGWCISWAKKPATAS